MRIAAATCTILLLACETKELSTGTDAAPASGGEAGSAPRQDASAEAGTIEPPRCPSALPPHGGVVSVDAGAPIALASNQSQPRGMTIDQENVYWINAGTLGGVYKVAKTGGTPATLYQGAVRGVESLGLDSTSVYFSIDGSIVAVSIAGGAPRIVASARFASGVAVAGGYAYWVDQQDGPMKAPTAGGTPARIPITDTPTQPRPAGAFKVVASTDAVYAGVHGRGILRLPLDSGTGARLVASGPGGIAFDETSVYFAGNSTVDKIAKAGGCPTPIAAAFIPYGIAVDDSFVYFTELEPRGRIKRVAKVSGIVSVLASDQGAPESIAVDATSIYWSNVDSGTINRLPK